MSESLVSITLARPLLDLYRSSMGYIRLILAISVVVAHSGKLPIIGMMIGGSLAVQCFFILSGFYMALVLDRKYSDIRRFWWNRFSRVYSGYAVALGFSAIISLYIGYSPITEAFEA